MSMVDLGLATSATGGTDGSGNVSEVRLPHPSHDAILDDANLEIVAEDAPLTDAPVIIRELEPRDAPSLTRCIYRCYGWTYPGTDFYYPERVAAAISRGARLGEVAVDEHGEVVAHWGAVFVAEGVVESGGTVTDPRFRRRGLADQLGERLLGRLIGAGANGRMREPVLTHSATQSIALREGATVVGILLNATEPIQQIGITDGLLSHRPSLSQMYSALTPLEPATIWVPSAYEPIVRHIVEATDWPRDFGHIPGSIEAPATSSVSSSYDSNRHTGEVTVAVIGTDLIDALDATLEELRHAGAEVATVHLPANDPALLAIGAGLDELSLSFASFIPRFGAGGDSLMLQWLHDPEVDDSDWVFADDRVRSLARLVIDQARDLGERSVRERRRHARRRTLFATLADD
jgi:GNAT superfamily N-acetyltransferase